jgi:hypothetical protein
MSHRTDDERLSAMLEGLARESEAACLAHLDAGDMRAAAVHQRRAAAAREGVLSQSPDELCDPDFALRHAELSRLAHRAHRVLWSEQRASADDFEADDPEHD